MPSHKIVRSFTATERDLEMLEALARYHGFSKSATITSLVKKEFWRIFPAGNGAIRPDHGARIADEAKPTSMTSSKRTGDRAR